MSARAFCSPPTTPILAEKKTPFATRKWRWRLRPSDGNVLYNAACTYGVLGRKAEALAMIRRAQEAGYANTDWPRIDPDLACIHDDPEFKSLFPAPASHA